MHDTGVHLRTNTAASASGPLAFEAALANFANSGISMPELLGDGEESLSGELDHIENSMQPDKLESGAAADKPARRLLVDMPRAYLNVSKEVRSN